jgi:hypothetical protein
MRWNIGWFICVLFAGPVGYGLMALLQPTAKTMLVLLFGGLCVVLIVKLALLTLQIFFSRQ